MTLGLGALMLAAAAGPKPAVVSVHADKIEGRAAVAVVTTTAPVRVGLERVDTEVRLTLDARLPAAFGPVAAVPPLEAIQVAATTGGVLVTVRVARDVPYEVRRQGTLLTVLFGEKAVAQAAAGPAGADVQELYRGLRPSADTDAPDAPASEETAGQAQDLPAAESEGLRFGLLTLRPSVSGVYVDAESALLETAQPVADQYYEVRPQVAADMPLGTGQLRGDYEVRLRQGSSFDIVEDSTTHLANAGLELPVGPSIVARANGHFSRGLLETTEVDPGREYFFQLGRYTRLDLSGGLRVQTGGRLDLDVSGSRYRLQLDERAGFFDYEGWTGAAGVGVELGPRVRALASYTYEEIPTPARRPEAAMQAHSGSLSLRGEVLPLVTGFATVGYRDQRNRNAGEGGTRYRGVTASVRLLKEFSRSTTLQLAVGRSTPPSAFESNGFFVATSVAGELNLALPFSVVAHAGAGYHRNEYRIASPEIGAPRADRITSWLGGLGRSLTEWAFARADYRYEQRQSNIERFETDAHSLTVQVGVRLYRPRVQR